MPVSRFTLYHSQYRSDSAFTLIELLIVIAIIAILSIVVVLTLNPAQLLMQGRDSNRVSDLATINTALGVYSAQGGISFGNTNTVYVSIPDPSATSTAGDQCQGLGLISLPVTYTYHCAASSTYRLTNGTGWIPVNFASLAGGSPLGSLPIDPLNTSSTRNYYAYATNGTQYEMTAPMESTKYQLGGNNDVISGDGGTLATVYEKGTTFGLEPLDYGDSSLLGDWSFDEGTGTVAYDYSGNNVTGTWNGTQAGTNGYYSPGKIGSWAGYFNGDNVNMNVANIPVGGAPRTMTAWANFANLGSGVRNDIVSWGTNSLNNLSAMEALGNIVQFGGFGNDCTGNITFSTSTWIQFATTYDGANARIYVNGVLDTTCSEPSWNTVSSSVYIGQRSAGGEWMQGLIDDVRVYNRALTAAQIAAMYSGGK